MIPSCTSLWQVGYAHHVACFCTLQKAEVVDTRTCREGQKNVPMVLLAPEVGVGSVFLRWDHPGLWSFPLCLAALCLGLRTPAFPYFWAGA